MLALGIFDFNPFPTDPGACAENGVATLSCIPNVLPVVITLAVTFAFVVCLILIVYSGIKFMTSGGDEKQVEGARKTLTFSIIGLIVVLSSFFIVQLISKQTGVGCLTKFGFEQCGVATCSSPPPAGFCPAHTHPVCNADTGHSWSCANN